MKKTKLFAAFLTAIIAVSLCGCGNVDGEVSITPADEISRQTSELVSSIADSASDISLPESEKSAPTEENVEFPTKCKIYKQTPKQFTEEQLLSFFSDTPKKVDRGVEDEIYYESDTEKGAISSGYFRYGTLNGYKYEHCAELLLANSDISEYADDTFDFAAREEVLAQLKSLMRDKFGIPEEEWYTNEMYAIKKEEFDRYKQAINDAAKEPVTSDSGLDVEKWKEQAEHLKNITSDDYYYISLGFNIDGNPYYGGRGFYYGQDESTLVPNYMASAVYTKNGVESITFINILETDTASAKETDIISPDEARVLMDQKKDGIISDGQIEIYDMRFVYLPIPQNDLGEYFKNFETRPFYAFYYKMPEKIEDEVIMSERVTYFDAVTGAEFATEYIFGNG